MTQVGYWGDTRRILGRHRKDTGMMLGDAGRMLAVFAHASASDAHPAVLCWPHAPATVTYRGAPLSLGATGFPFLEVITGFN